MRHWQEEFDAATFDVPAEIDALVDNGTLADASWHKDICPKFEILSEQGPIRHELWVDPVNPADREWPRPRYQVTAYNFDTCEHLDNLLDTDSLPEVLALLNKLDAEARTR